MSEHKQLQQLAADATTQGFDPALEYAGDDATTNSTVETSAKSSILNNKTLQMQHAILKELAKLFCTFGLKIPHTVQQLPGLDPAGVSGNGTASAPPEGAAVAT